VQTLDCKYFTELAIVLARVRIVSLLAANAESRRLLTWLVIVAFSRSYRAPQRYTLVSSSADERNAWLRELYDLQNFVPTEKLAGRRMASVRPAFRTEALKILGVRDPATEAGVADIKLEFKSLPKVRSITPSHSEEYIMHSEE
jgi:hypothetical protein